VIIISLVSVDAAAAAVATPAPAAPSTGSSAAANLQREFLAGLVASLATIPTSMAYSTIVGVNPLTGIWSSMIIGFIVALVGGGPGVIAGSAGVSTLFSHRLDMNRV
jgi:MFS superfamily sulfate permease-like transporter